MAEGASEQVIVGVPAAEGLAIGKISLDVARDVVLRKAGQPPEEREALKYAIDKARSEIDGLIDVGDDLASEILEFQQALLEDEDLTAPIYEAVASGQAAQDAWSQILDGEIEQYRSGGDEYFAARAEDLVDLKTRVLRALYGGLEEARLVPLAGAIFVADDLTPSRFLELDWKQLAGAAIRGGSRTSHVAILARARGVPLVVGLDADLAALPDGSPAILDAEAGALILEPSGQTMTAARGRLDARAVDAKAAEGLLAEPAVTAGGERVEVLINVDDPAMLAEFPPGHCDGIGLTRTEFLFQGGRLPDEESQFQAYRRVLEWAAGRSVTIRTLDAGGDKPIPGVTPDGESNPFLGVRGLRLSLRHEALFRVQLRALARAAACGPLKVMVPMVTVPAELKRVRRLMDDICRELSTEGIEHAAPALGMMVEVPAAALTAECFEADFYSIGSNDLVQYVTASARDNPNLEAIADPSNPAVLELVVRTVEAARRRGVGVSLCGDMASDPASVPALLDRGLRSLSVAPAQVGPVKLAVSRYGARGGAA